MGEGISVKCSECGYSEGFSVGIGMFECSLENVIERLPYKIKSKVGNLIKEHNIDEYDFNRKLTQCIKCKSLSSKEVSTIHYDGDKVFETNLSCSKCKGELKVIKDLEEIKKLPCPDCGRTSLNYSVDILWD